LACRFSDAALSRFRSFGTMSQTSEVIWSFRASMHAPTMSLTFASCRRMTNGASVPRPRVLVAL
jgi:hypothetical protein